MVADMVHEVYWAEAVWREVYPTCVSSKLCEFIWVVVNYPPGQQNAERTCKMQGTLAVLTSA